MNPRGSRRNDLWPESLRKQIAEAFSRGGRRAVFDEMRGVKSRAALNAAIRRYCGPNARMEAVGSPIRPMSREETRSRIAALPYDVLADRVAELLVRNVSYGRGAA